VKIIYPTKTIIKETNKKNKIYEGNLKEDFTPNEKNEDNEEVQKRMFFIQQQISEQMRLNDLLGESESNFKSAIEKAYKRKLITKKVYERDLEINRYANSAKHGELIFLFLIFLIFNFFNF